MRKQKVFMYLYMLALFFTLPLYTDDSDIDIEMGIEYQTKNNNITQSTNSETSQSWIHETTQKIKQQRAGYEIQLFDLLERAHFENKDLIEHMLIMLKFENDTIVHEIRTTAEYTKQEVAALAHDNVRLKKIQIIGLSIFGVLALGNIAFHIF